jgi:hypothetical protein
MTLSLPEFLPKFQRRHGIYVMRQTFEGTCAFLTGFEVGSDRFVLKEFHAWLVQRGGGRPELFWPYLLLAEIYPDADWPDIRYFTEEQDEQAVALLFTRLHEYFATL